MKVQAEDLAGDLHLQVQKDRIEANPERPGNAKRIQLQMHPNVMSERKCDATDWYAIEELWRGL